MWDNGHLVRYVPPIGEPLRESYDINDIDKRTYKAVFKRSSPVIDYIIGSEYSSLRLFLLCILKVYYKLQYKLAC